MDTSRMEIAHYFPDVLPGSELVLFSISRENQYDVTTRDIAVAHIDTGEVQVLFDGVQAVWSESGHIVAVRGNGTLVAATFHPETKEVGPVIPMFQGVQIESLASVDLAMSENGTLIYVPGPALDQIPRRAVWMDRNGNATDVDPDWTRLYSDPRISPDGSKLAVTTHEGNEEHIWVKDLDTGPLSKMTFQGRVNSRPVWRPDGNEVAFVSDRAEDRDVYQRRADGATATERIFDVDGMVQEVEFSRDGEWMVVRVGTDIFAQRTSPGSELVPLIADPDAEEVAVAISPDSRWIAYASDETGERLVYVRPFPDVNDGKWPVSVRPATSPRWAQDGRELYYRTIDGDFVAAEVISFSPFALGVRTTLFPFRGMVADDGHAQYDIHPEGHHFLMIQIGIPDVTSSMVVIENFNEELKESSRSLPQR